MQREPSLSGRRRIYLIRHGEVNYFPQQSQMDQNPPLSSLGRAQVAQTAAFLEQNNVVVDRILSSTLLRSRETAQIIGSSLGVTSVENFDSLCEIHGGDVSALSRTSLDRAFFAGVRLVPGSWAFMNGETIRDFTTRVDSEIEALRLDDTWKVALLAVHGGVNTAIISRALSGNRGAYFASIEQDYACLNVLDIGAEPEDWVVRLINFAAHHPLHPTPRETTLEHLLSRHGQAGT
ncbi:histidine phosphatase family protein [Burkholderia diffusa]|uniref:Phosphoglycerate mutase n=1 Tax=Burkholderia diffusa TaxID=488732 RepID=A0A6P2R0S6_9BURK|nr:histidine phosphatase family protein [Burkholderia diffusa]KAB0653816.1 histidine phosphatase family protein [Burkholderia diffusa]MBM2656957.1 histidine phosphatase family protein [Burkholderia diffusa]VWC28190.1 phosphoglycerate mutase [Burkholderia diffusa]